MDKPPVDCPLEPGVSCELVRTVTLLRDEVMRLNHAVAKLERIAAGRVVKIRDVMLTMAGVMVSLASCMWMLQAL